MARTRMVEPDFFLNERLAALPAHARLLFIGVWQLADREGRLEDRPRKIKAALFPWEEVDVDELLWRLASREGLRAKEQPFLIRYEVDSEPLIFVPAFTAHQRPHIREVESTLPAVEKGRERTSLGDASAPPRPRPGEAQAAPQENPSIPDDEAEKHAPRPVQGEAQATPRCPVSDSESDPDPDHRAGAARAPATGWDPLVLEELRRALGREQLPTNDREWQEFVASSVVFPPEQRIAAAREYIGRRNAPGTHGPAYVLAMIKARAGQLRNGNNAGAVAEPIPKWKQRGASSAEEYERWMTEARKHAD